MAPEVERGAPLWTFGLPISQKGFREALHLQEIVHKVVNPLSNLHNSHGPGTILRKPTQVE
jgi:hypothetical protein